MFDLVPGLAIRLRMYADAAGFPGTHEAYAKAAALEAAIASGVPTTIAAAYTEAERTYSRLQAGV